MIKKQTKFNYFNVPPIPPGVSLKTIGLYKRTFLDYDDIVPFVEEVKFLRGTEVDEDGFFSVALKLILSPEVPEGIRPDYLIIQYQGLSETDGRTPSTNDFVPIWVAKAVYKSGDSLSFRSPSRYFLPTIRRFIKGGNGRGVFF